ncbi:hypothetical protein KAR91_67860 [Candidatus Pacearchaeota archaeon]|nr:hypothetical protein [Candidatus Pacearchaeota archaeon]
MLRMLTSLNLVSRYDITATAGLLASGVTGSWVSKLGDNIDLPGTQGDQAQLVWTESNRDGTVGWTPDVTNTGKLTVLTGKTVRALTDQFSGTPAVGDAFVAGVNGKLYVNNSAADTNLSVVAYCTKASHVIEHLGRNHTVIEFTTT